MNIKNDFSHFFATIFFPTFFARSIGLFLEKLFRAFFPLFYGHDIRVNIKNVFSDIFRRFFPYIFCPHYWCVSGKIVSRVFSPILGHDIRVIIKNDFSHFFATILFPTFFARLLVCFFKNCIARFSTPFFVTIFVCI